MLFSGLNEAIAQKDFEGKIVYTIEYLRMPDEMKGMEAMLPKGMTSYVKGNQSRMEQDSGMGGQTIVLHNSDDNETVVLMNMLGQKMAVVPSAEEKKQAEADMDKVEVKLMDEEKDVAGYKCKKAVMTSPDMDFPMTIFYTEAIPNGSADLAKVPGMPLEYTTEQQGMKMRIAASTISKEKVGKSMFDIPKDYERMTGAELQEKFQGLGN